jgi:prepilin-type N-terminal cleavage/methylation domain-containing protein
MNRLLRPTRDTAAERGMTLVEVLVTVTILGLAVAGIMGGMEAAARGSDIHRKGVNADTVVRDWAEAIKQRVRLGAYQECVPGDATPPDYSPSNVGYTSVPPGYNLTVPSGGVAYQTSSNLNLIIVLDRSGSIAPSASQARAAVKGFLDTLNKTGTVVSLVSFAQDSKVEATPTPITDSTLAGLKAKVDAITFSGYTNWDDGLATALSQVSQFAFGPAPLVVVVTDGDPNTYRDDTTGVVAIDSSSTRPLTEAVRQSALLKGAAHSHVFTIGVNGTGGLLTANLQAISGPNQYPATAFASADWMTVNDFNVLSGALTGIAAAATTDTFSSTCPASGDQGTQRLSLLAASADGRASETLDVLMRRP